MILIIDLSISAHEPDAGVIVITFGSIAVIPLAVKFYQKPVVNVAVISGITVDSHALDSCSIKEHLAACIVNVAVTVVLCESSVCSILKIRSPA